MSDLTLVSLFAGIEGFGLAFDRAGVKTVASVEIDKHARQVIRKNFPHSTIFNDVTEVTGNDLRAVGFIPERGIITFGFPCTDISIAGKGEGLAGQRSSLFFEAVRLIGELRPKWIVAENVPRLLSINGGRDMAAVTECLVELGYCLAWRVLDAQHCGVPQRRRRIFVVGHSGESWAAPAKVLFESEGLSGDFASGGEAGPEVAVGVGDGVGAGGESRSVAHTHTHTHCEHASGWRETRLPDRRGSSGGWASNRVNALTASALRFGADENVAQAGQLVVDKQYFDGSLR